MRRQLLKQIMGYAELIVCRGVALEKGQTLVITCTTETLYFARMIAEAAYNLGAGDVQVRIDDDVLTQLRYLNASYDQLVQHLIDKHKLTALYTEREACFVRICSDDPDELQGISPERVQLITQAKLEAGRNSGQGSMGFSVRRHASPAPSCKWAEKVFSHLQGDEAVRALWGAILHITYAEGANAVADWDNHIVKLKQQKATLNNYGFTELHFSNASGTQLSVGLADDAFWYGGCAWDVKGNEFFPSVPTEEIFTAPHRGKTNGTVKSSLPLYYNGTCIDGFSLTFKEGRVIAYSAERGLETLKAILDSDKGSNFLGEVALVPADSRLAKSGLEFHQTLCDENRSSHLALGAGYPGCIAGADTSVEALREKGLNFSTVHVDFMIGTDDMLITGTTKEGRVLTIMKNGQYQI